MGNSFLMPDHSHSQDRKFCIARIQLKSAKENFLNYYKKLRICIDIENRPPSICKVIALRKSEVLQYYHHRSPLSYHPCMTLGESTL